MKIALHIVTDEEREEVLEMHVGNSTNARISVTTCTTMPVVKAQGRVRVNDLEQFARALAEALQTRREQAS